jgi:polyvinyl alcohol dehydrogenase (cytochrome)
MRYIVANARGVWGRPWARIVGGVGILVILVAMAINIPARPTAHAANGDWSTYLGDNGRSGFNPAETIINPTTAPGLKKHWVHKAGGKISSQPIEANGLVYWGSWDGIEHATNPSNGVDLWAVMLGQRTANCRGWSLGVLSTATFASVSIGGVVTPVIIVGGDDTQLYELNANTGAIIWQTVIGTPPSHFLYSSPAVFNGNIYIGVSGSDCSLVQGQMVQVDASTGLILHTFNVVPNGCTGGSVWSSPAIDNTTGMLYFSTGEKGKCSIAAPMPMATALVELKASDLSFVGSWQVPKSVQVPDGDFGSSPTLFKATIGGVLHQMVGLVNKNGNYYAFDRTNISSGPLWAVRVAIPGPPSGSGDSISSSAWDGSTLYVSAAQTTSSDSICPSTPGAGSLKALDPATGSINWEFCLPLDAKDPVSAVPGLVFIGSGTSLFVINASTGQQLFTFQDLHSQSNFWGPAMISNGILFQGNQDGYMYAFGL